jgi:hypothetical protein
MARRASGGGAMVSMEVDPEALKRLAEFAAALRKAMEPIRAKAKSEIMSLPSAGLRRGGAPLRASVARQVRAEVRVDAREPGATLVAGNNGLPRDFKMAPRRLNQSRPFRHPVFGNREVWVHQKTKRGWFYRPQRAGATEYQAAIKRIMTDLAERLARRARR